MQGSRRSSSVGSGGKNKLKSAVTKPMAILPWALSVKKEGNPSGASLCGSGRKDFFSSVFIVYYMKRNKFCV